MMMQVDRLAGGILPLQKKRNVESRLPVFDHPENDNIKLDSKDSHVLQKEFGQNNGRSRRSLTPSDLQM